MHRRIVATLILAAALMASLPAHAITYGELDGDRHPNVGALVAEWRQVGQKDLLCSGTLISPTVFLTAAHCTDYLESQGISEVWVTFDSSYTATSKIYPGTMHTNPNYTFQQDDPGDIAVVVLERAIQHLTPAKLPKAGLFDQMKAAGTLKNQLFVNVGYGVHEPVVGPGGAVFPDTNDRWTSTSSFDALNNAWLRLKQTGATGDGGTCYGDSGGPQFIGDSDTLAAITVTGDAMCLATNTTYRLDAPGARNFLANYVTLP